MIKVIWGRDWDPLLAQDVDGVLVNKMNTTPDGQFQTYAVESGAYIRENFFGGDPRLRAMVEHLSDDELRNLSRGGHDYRKVYAAFKAATEHVGQPTVILAHTIKGWTLGPDFEARNATHQMKKLTVAELKEFRDRLYLEIPDSALEAELPPYYHPGENSDEIQYMKERRAALGGYLPRRVVRAQPLTLPADTVYDELRSGLRQAGGGHHDGVRPAAQGPDEGPGIGDRFVPIIPDEARTFGMDSLFPTAKIYSPHGQTYEAVDRNLLLSYKESAKGQILHEGISEAGAMGSMIAAGTSYATHGTPMIPVYIFYSMFGFQRTGDQMWALGDQLGRGFLLGATAGRTTLTGEGLQHNDGHSVLLASVSPACVAYDAAWAYELAYIVQGRAAPDVRLDRRAPGRREHLLLPDRLQRAVRAGRRARRLPRRHGRAGAGHPARPVPVRARRPDAAAASAGSDAEPTRRSPATAERPAGADPGLRRGAALGAGGAAAAGRGLGRGRRGLVGHVLDRAAPRRDGLRRVEPAAPRRGARGCRT